jgi:small-conductance mechanosensitive channel
MENFLVISKPYLPYLIALVAFLIGYLLRKYSFLIINRITSKTETKIDDIVFETVKKPSIIWLVMLSIDLGSQVLEVSYEIHAIIDRVILSLLIVSVFITLMKLTVELLKLYYEKRNSSFHTTSIIQNLIKIVFFLTGVLLILQINGVSITPIITALGIGGLAVALALQDTLNNLFSGFYITLSQQIRVGDFIRLENGSEGWVKDIGWRNTTLLLITNSMIIIPNSKLAQNIILNYSLPESRTALKFPINVGYEHDPDFVEKIILDLLKENISNIPGALSEPQPTIILNPGFSEYALTFTLTVHIEQYFDPGPALGAVRKLIIKKFKEENIRIPYPIYTIINEKGQLIN